VSLRADPSPADSQRDGAPRIRVGLRVADVPTGRVEGTVDASAPLADVLAAEKALAFRAFDALDVTLAPDERAAIERRPTSSLAALLAYGEGVRRMYLGDARGAAAAFRHALRLDPAFQPAGERARSAQALAESGAANPVLIPGTRPAEAAVGSAVDRLNRPLDPISSFGPSASRTADPSVATTGGTLIITITRP
jgi:hypothetical protein